MNHVDAKDESYCFIHIPEDKWPDKSLHIDYDPVFRATKNDAKLTVEDFIPSNMEDTHHRRIFKELYLEYYSVSLFTNLDSLMNKIQTFPSLKEKTKAIAKGKTTIYRGISTQENRDHHVNYYLYDYINNSPKDDFEIIMKLNQQEG